LNENHLRPLLAFGCLAMLAAIISSIGLQSGATDVRVHAGTPAPVTAARSSDFLIGDALEPASRGTAGSRDPSVAWSSSTARQHVIATSSVANSTEPAGGGGSSAVASSSAGTVPDGTVTPTTTTATTTTTGPGRSALAKGHGKGRLKTAKATTTASPDRTQPKVDHGK
jgi:hypothetical protein